MKEMVAIWTPITPDNVNLVLALENFFLGGANVIWVWKSVCIGMMT